MTTTPLTFGNRLQRVCLITATTSVLFSLMLATAGDIWGVRYFSTEDFSNLVNAVTTADGFVSARDNPERMRRYLKEFAAIAGLQQVCLYGASNALIGQWQDEKFTAPCPEFASEQGLKRHWQDISIGIPVKHNGTYLGLVQASGRLFTFKEVMIHEAIIACALLICAGLVAFLVQHITQRDLRPQLKAVHDQLECLRDPLRTDCSLLPKKFTVEMAGVMAAVSHLHEHYMQTMVSRQTLERSREWHGQIFADFVATLKSRMSADSPLLRDINDYALLMQTEYDTTLPQARLFDFPALLDKTLADTRRIHPPHKRVHLSVSLQPGMPRLWFGHPELLEVLLRHLLLIAFRRTKEGIVLLRLASEPATTDKTTLLNLYLEDSGPPLQPWQLRQWLRHSWEEEKLTEEEHTISWVLAARLFHYLKGRASAAPAPEGGLRLMGSLPLSAAGDEALITEAANHTVDTHLSSPLILAVESETLNQRELLNTCAQAGYGVFIVQDHAQALEWALCLPVSVILFNMSAASSWDETAKRLHQQMRQHIMPQASIWALTVTMLPGRHEGIEQLLIAPLQADILKNLRPKVRVIDTGFYHVYDETLRGDLPPSVIERMPYLHQQLALELARMKEMAEKLARDHTCPEAAQQAHAIKSVALSMGYFRLAALMTEVEHAAITQSFSRLPQNWSVIAECLAQAGVAPSSLTQNPAARLAVSL